MKRFGVWLALAAFAFVQRTRDQKYRVVKRRGRPHSNVVDAFVDQLNASPLYEVDKDETVFKRSVPNDSDWAYDFAFPLILKSAPEGGKTKAKAK